MTGLLKGYMCGCEGNCSLVKVWKRWIDIMKVSKEKRFGCQASKENSV